MDSNSDVKVFVDKVKEELGFVMEYPEKVSKAVFGVSTNKGLTGGVGYDASAKVILAKYDELNGYITQNGYKVKNRTFFDTLTKKPVLNPDVVLLIRVNGELVEHREGEKETPEIQIAKRQVKEEKKKKETKVK